MKSLWWIYHLICTVDPASHTSLGEGEVIVTELAQTSCNAAVNDKTREVILNIFLSCCVYKKWEEGDDLFQKKKKGKRKKKEEKQEKRDDQVIKKK
jgi:hypothetical protein